MRIYRTLYPSVGGPRDRPPYERLALAIESYLHSGNTFLRSNILPADRERITSHNHLAWMLVDAVRFGVPTIVLLRDPLEVAKSMHLRSLQPNEAPIPIWVALCCWIGYHRTVWKYRDQIRIFTFDDLITNYGGTRRAIEKLGSIRLEPLPSMAEMNEFKGQRAEIALNAWNKLFLKHAQALHDKLRASDARQLPAMPAASIQPEIA